jgi:hypothetical protein
LNKVNNLSVLTASASVNANDILHISINNIHATASQNLTITINGGTYDSISGQIVNGPAINSYNDFGEAETVNIKKFTSSNFSHEGKTVTVTLPAHSVVMLKLTPATTIVTDGSEPPVACRRVSVTPLGNRIMVEHGFISPTTITISLFSINGKSVTSPLRTIAQPGQNILWEPKIRSPGTNILVVKTAAGRVKKSKRLLLMEWNSVLSKNTGKL